MTGDAARDWMLKAQAFAGAATDGPVPPRLKTFGCLDTEAVHVGLVQSGDGRRRDHSVHHSPFRIAVSDEALDDLRRRLTSTRWPERELVDDWSQGTPLAYVQDVCEYWASGYDWRAREAALNRFDQFTTVIDDLDLHFIHVRSPHADAVPLLITHGWPGSIVEFHKIIEPLTEPDRVRRRRRRRVPRRRAVAARLRVLGQAAARPVGASARSPRCSPS